MKSRILSLLAIATIAVASMTSCSKYEDGPGFSLRTKKARLTGEWELKEMTQDGEKAEGVTMLMEINKDDKYKTTITVTYEVNGETQSDVDVEEGKWEFANKKEALIFTDEADGLPNDIITVTRLTNKELWVKDLSGTQTMKFEKK